MTDTPAKPVVAGMSAREVITRAMRPNLTDADYVLRALTSAGYAVVPVEPTEAMWGGLARQIVLWRDMISPTGQALYQHLTASGYEIPGWLRKEILDTNHVPAKGDVAVCIYRAMLAASSEGKTP